MKKSADTAKRTRHLRSMQKAYDKPLVSHPLRYYIKYQMENTHVIDKSTGHRKGKFGHVCSNNLEECYRSWLRVLQNSNHHKILQVSFVFRGVDGIRDIYFVDFICVSQIKIKSTIASWVCDQLGVELDEFTYWGYFRVPDDIKRDLRKAASDGRKDLKATIGYLNSIPTIVELIN